jgi:hypothetical protein
VRPIAYAVDRAVQSDVATSDIYPTRKLTQYTPVKPYVVKPIIQAPHTVPKLSTVILLPLPHPQNITTQRTRLQSVLTSPSHDLRLVILCRIEPSRNAQHRHNRTQLLTNFLCTEKMRALNSIKTLRVLTSQTRQLLFQYNIHLIESFVERGVALHDYRYHHRNP